MFVNSPLARPFFPGLLLATTLSASLAVHAQTVTADFASRNGATKIVPSGLFAIGGTGSSLSNRPAIGTLTNAALNETRLWVSLNQIYKTTTANFGSLDATLTTMQATGVHPLAVIQGTPPSLGATACAPPSDIWKWGQMAASIVAHVDQKYPGLIRDYEIWNEPELPTSLCITSDATRLSTYLAMFADAASAMHTQANTDKKAIRTGGPVISRVKVMGPVWIPALLSNAATAPYVDFVSFHIYLTGLTDIQNGMSWSTLFATTQSTTAGLAYYYKLLEPYVRKGKQPNAAATPIYISEYNDNWAFAVDCCRNDANYGPLWNGIAISDLLNSVYNGATQVPSQLGYFNSVGSYFCLLGKWDSGMDCNTGATTPYPQFYAFQLFASSQFLDLQAGGHMAASVSPNTSTSLNATAFYTNLADNVVIINPWSTNYTAVSVVLKNPGLSGATATQYLLNKANAKITSKALALTAVTGGYSAKVAVPPYSTVAISLKGGQSSSPPKAWLTVSPLTGTHPLYVTADSSKSTGGATAITGRTISFGDGSWTNSLPTATHTYSKAGTYKVLLTIKNQGGQISTSLATVTVH